MAASTRTRSGSRIRSSPPRTSSMPAIWSRSSTRWCGGCAWTGIPSVGVPRRSAFSRPVLYQAQAALTRGGLAALVPKKPGPRRAHKLSPEVVDFLHQAAGRGCRPARPGAGAARAGAVRPHGPSAQRRAGLGPPGKKTVVTTSPATAPGRDVFGAAYEDLRRRVLAGAAVRRQRPGPAPARRARRLDRPARPTCSCWRSDQVRPATATGPRCTPCTTARSATGS